MKEIHVVYCSFLHFPKFDGDILITEKVMWTDEKKILTTWSRDSRRTWP